MAPETDGYVTRVASSSDFDVNGYRILCGRKTKTSVGPSTGKIVTYSDCPGGTPYVGECMTIYGRINDKSRVITADLIEAKSFNPEAITGSAVIDGIPSGSSVSAQPDRLLVRADGYSILIHRETKIAWAPPLHALTDIKLGDWIGYEGTPNGTGIVIASKVKLSPESITQSEEKLRAKNEYDPSSVPADAKQNLLKDAFALGYDPKKFPPFDDAAMQARVEKIGNSLVPAYQRALPDSDASKIQFRFHLVDNKHFCGMLPCDAFTLPSGMILVPHQVVERMQNDSQLAAVLADAIARALERQQYRIGGKVKTAYASAAAASFVPYGGGFGTLAGEGVASKLLMKEMEQSGRVSFTLLHDAGYDIDQAPMAWWLLASRKPQPISEIDMPDRAAYLYRILGESWHNPGTAGQQP